MPALRSPLQVCTHGMSLVIKTMPIWLTRTVAIVVCKLSLPARLPTASGRSSRAPPTCWACAPEAPASEPPRRTNSRHATSTSGRTARSPTPRAVCRPTRRRESGPSRHSSPTPRAAATPSGSGRCGATTPGPRTRGAGACAKQPASTNKKTLAVCEGTAAPSRAVGQGAPSPLGLEGVKDHQAPSLCCSRLSGVCTGRAHHQDVLSNVSGVLFSSRLLYRGGSGA
jgi:hypothetical protein